MNSCKNCFTSVDMRSAVKCAVCNAPLHKDCAINDGGTFCDVCYTVKTEGGDAMKVTNFEVPAVIRRSYIEQYKSCPYSFYLNVIKGVEQAPSSFAQIGIDLHELFKEACEGKYTSSDSLRVAYLPIWNKYEDNLFEQDLHLYKDMDVPRFKKKMENQINDAIDTFSNILCNMPKQAFALEQTIEFSIGDDLPKVQITMDRVDKDGDYLIISDWKTGAVKTGQALSSDLQTPLYIKAIRDHFGLPVKEFNFYYLPENKVRTWIRVDDENYICTVNKREYKINITDAVREVQTIFSHIKKGNFNIPKDAKKLYFTCKTCYYKRSGTCQGADMESWKQYNGGIK